MDNDDTEFPEYRIPTLWQKRAVLEIFYAKYDFPTDYFDFDYLFKNEDHKNVIIFS